MSEDNLDDDLDDDSEETEDNGSESDLSDETAADHIRQIYSDHGLSPVQDPAGVGVLQDILSTGANPELANHPKNNQQANDLQKLLLVTQLKQQTENPERIRQAQLAQNSNDLMTRLAEAGQKIGAGMAGSGGIAIQNPDTSYYQNLRSGFQPVQQLESQETADAKRLQAIAVAYAKLNAGNKTQPLQVNAKLQTSDGRNVYPGKDGNNYVKNEKTGTLEVYHGKVEDLSIAAANEKNHQMAIKNDIGKKGLENQVTTLLGQESDRFQKSPAYEQYQNTIQADTQLSNILQHPENYNQLDFVAAATAASKIPGFDVDKVKGGTQSLNQIVTNIINQGEGKSAITKQQLQGLQNIGVGVHNSILPRMHDEVSVIKQRLKKQGLDEPSVLSPKINDWYNNYNHPTDEAKKVATSLSTTSLNKPGSPTLTKTSYDDSTNITTYTYSDGHTDQFSGPPKTR